jgi:Acyl-CoA dehydrogenase, C-terminal domain
VRLLFDAQQRGFAESIRGLLARECTPAMMRQELDGGPRNPRRWQALCAAGLVDTGVSAEDIALALEETGRFALADPVVESALVAPPLLGRAGDRVAVQLTARGRYCVDADRAEVLLLQHGDALHSVAPSDVCMAEQSSLDHGRRVFALQWQPEVRTQVSDGADAVAAAFDRGAFGASAQLLGLAARMIDMAAEHARTREQFGRPIGSFQAVKHLLADALLALEFARPVVYRAAWSVTQDVPERARDVSMAKAFASDAARVAGRTALQIHGAIGYTWAHDLQIWMKRAESLASDWGDAAWHRRRVAAWFV